MKQFCHTIFFFSLYKSEGLLESFQESFGIFDSIFESFSIFWILSTSFGIIFSGDVFYGVSSFCLCRTSFFQEFPKFACLAWDQVPLSSSDFFRVPKSFLGIINNSFSIFGSLELEALDFCFSQYSILIWCSSLPRVFRKFLRLQMHCMDTKVCKESKTSLHIFLEVS